MNDQSKTAIKIRHNQNTMYKIKSNTTAGLFSSRHLSHHIQGEGNRRDPWLFSIQGQFCTIQSPGDSLLSAEGRGSQCTSGLWTFVTLTLRQFQDYNLPLEPQGQLARPTSQELWAVLCCWMQGVLGDGVLWYILWQGYGVLLYLLCMLGDGVLWYFRW